jgi:hypothetical protein
VFRFVPLALSAVLLAGGVAGAEVATGSSASAAGGGFAITGHVKHPLHLRLADLAKYPQHTVQVTFVGGKPERTQNHTFSGPLLIDVLNAAGPQFDAAAKNDALRWGILVTGSGNYRALIAWSELDPHLGAKQVLLSMTEDGKPLDAPRIALPDDKGGGRYVGGVTDVRLNPVG